jgi:hypothetical protein
LDPVGSGQGPVTGSCEYRDEPSGSGATEIVNLLHGSVVSGGWVTVNGTLERYRRKGLKKILTNFRLDIWPCGGEWNPGLTEYEAKILTTRM